MDDLAIKVENVSKVFKLPHEKNSSIKSTVVNFYKRKKGYELQKALDDVTFEIKKGEFFGIVGRNGSGKSTLLKLIAGIYTPTKGQIHIRGTLTPFIELGVGFNPELTGRENVYLNGALLGFNRKEMEAMYSDIVEFAELKRFMDQKLKNYSSGMQVRLAFSIAIRAKSDILLLDEVLAVGDAAFQQKCYNYFEKLKSQNKTVVFVSHDMGAVTRFCTKAIYIKDSKLIKEGTPLDIADLYREENISSEILAEANQDGEPRTSIGYKVTASLLKQTTNEAVMEIKYSAKNETQTYIGVTIRRDGTSVAEITTPLDRPLIGDGRLTYSIDTSILNGGSYEFEAALFNHKNRELLAFMNRRVKFAIKGGDITRGAALKLSDTWRYN